MSEKGRIYLKRKLSSKDGFSNYHQLSIMDNRSSTHSFPKLPHPRHRPPFHLTSAELGYASPQPALDLLDQYGSRGEEPTTSFPASNASSAGRRTSSGGDGGLVNTSSSSLDGDVNLGGHQDNGGHFVEAWFGSSKKEDVWEDGEGYESTTDDFYGKGDCYGNTNDVFYSINCDNEGGLRRKLKANYNNHAHDGYETKSETVTVGHFTKQTTPQNRSTAGSFSDSSVEYCRNDSRVGDNYLGREEDFRSSCGSGEDQLQLPDVDGPWLGVNMSGEGRWKGTTDGHIPGCIPQRSPSDGTCTQKLDSFSEAFLSQRKGRFPGNPSGDPSRQIWDFGLGREEGPGLIRSRHNCAFGLSDPDSYLPPSSSSSPAHPSLSSFPSPPTSSHLMSSVLSPPPTPLPPPSLSPPKMDSPSTFLTTGYSMSQGTEPLGALQFFASRFQSLSSINSGMIWKFPLPTHGFPQSTGSPGNIEGNLRSPQGRDYGNTTASQNVLQSPEPSFLTSIHSPSPLCPSNPPSSLHPTFHPPSHASHLPGQHSDAAGTTAPYVVTRKVKNGPSKLHQPLLQQQATSVYTGTPFPSILHSRRIKKGVRYTPRPLLNPLRKGRGLHSSLSSLHHREEEEEMCGGDEDEGGVLPHINVGPDFQAEIPPCLLGADGAGMRLPEVESRRGETLLWKPLDILEETLKDQVEKLLSMCSSSCLPGGGSNTELALHCLHHCEGDTMVTLEMLLFSQPLPTGDYHYSGSDNWTESEKSLFSAALAAYGKEFSLIQKMVKTKTTRQCVEFFYLSKKLQDKQRKQIEEEIRVGEMEQKIVTPTCQPMNRQLSLEEAVPVPPLASFFPCKLCGKMFYKIKSRNAHMKIHRQPQEDWGDRRLQQHLLTQRLALSRPSSFTQAPGSSVLSPQAPTRSFSSSGLPGMQSNNSSAADNVLSSVTHSNGMAPSNASVLDPSSVVTYTNSHLITNIDGGDSNRREIAAVLPFHQSWGSFGQNSPTFFCSTEGKEDAGAGTVGAKEPINWQ